MRPIETLLLFANILTFLVVAVPQLHTTRWMGSVVLITLVLAVVQMFIEGPRWQMVPMYVLTGLFVLVWLLQNVGPGDGIVKQILTNRFIVSFAIILCIIGISLSAALPMLLPVYSFPRPSDPYGIGTVTYHWTDTSRREVFSPDKNRHRELMVQVWYPARKDVSAAPAPYMADADTVMTALARLQHLPDFFLNYLKYVPTHAAVAAPVANDRPRYPVLIFLEGLSGFRQMNTFQVEELVSHGFIVVGLDQPGVAASVVFPDGHQVDGLSKPQMLPLYNQSLSPVKDAPQWNGQTFKDGIIPYFAQDVSFTLDQLAALNTRDPQDLLTGKLDLEQTGVFGISFGGMVASQACEVDPRLAACLMMDVAMPANVVKNGLRQPSMWITRPAGTMLLERQKTGGWQGQEIEQTQTTMRAVYNQLPGDGYFVQVPGMFHIDCTDLDLLSPLSPTFGLGGPIGSQRAHEIINAYTLAFFDKHLKGEPEVLLEGSSAHYPEVIFEKRRP
jgi:pimeloyl-ACP methyl ester carboxylesterase